MTYTERKVALNNVAVSVVAQHAVKAQVKSLLEQLVVDLVSLQNANAALISAINGSDDDDQKNELSNITADFNSLTNQANAAITALEA